MELKLESWIIKQSDRQIVTSLFDRIGVWCGTEVFNEDALPGKRVGRGYAIGSKCLACVTILLQTSSILSAKVRAPIDRRKRTQGLRNDISCEFPDSPILMLRACFSHSFLLGKVRET